MKHGEPPGTGVSDGLTEGVLSAMIVWYAQALQPVCPEEHKNDEETMVPAG